jgi:hypothetical protein
MPRTKQIDRDLNWDAFMCEHDGGAFPLSYKFLGRCFETGKLFLGFLFSMINILDLIRIRAVSRHFEINLILQAKEEFEEGS